MAELNPAPSSLGRASPALGPWFTDDNGGALNPDITLALPNADLSVSVTLEPGNQWHAPAGCMRSYFIASPMDASTGHRPAPIAMLRQADGSAAFNDNDLVVLLRLLPEVELRLQALSSYLPAADAASGAPPATPAPAPTRPRIRYLAMSMDSSVAGSVGQLESLLTGDALPAGVSDDEKAAFVGLAIDASDALINGAQPTHELRLPADARSPVLQNGNVSALSAHLWAFDYRGRPVDAGAVATWWSHLASGNSGSLGTFNNLWADSDNQRTATAEAGNVVHLVSVNEGPLDDTSGRALLARVNPSNDLQEIHSDSTTPNILFSTSNPAGSGVTANIAFSDDPDTSTADDAPVPRVALLPHANYGPVAANATGSTVNFSAWSHSAWPGTLNRDFARVAVTDIEHLLTGLTRHDENQARTTTRIAATRNTAATPFATQTDIGTAQAISILAPGTNPRLVSPVMDRYWGALAPAATTTQTLPDTLDYTVRPLLGEGSTDTSTPLNTSESQQVVVHFTNLPANVWVRCWPHALDTETGRRFRQHGGGAQSDSNNEAFVVMAIPDGTAAADPDSSMTDAQPIRLSFDVLIVAGTNQRYYTELRYERPPTVSGARIPLDSVPDTTTLWLTEVGRQFNQGQNAYASGMTLLGIPEDRDGDYALVDLSTLALNDVFAGTLRGAVGAQGIAATLAVTTPAYVATDPGDIILPDNVNPDGDADFSNATLIHHERNLGESLDDFGRPVPTMERREVAGVNAGTDSNGSGATGLVGASPGRALNHEIPPSQLGHPGMPANAEIHGNGVTITGPAILPLTSVVNERMAKSLRTFANLAAQPLPDITDGGGTTAYVSILDTLTFGVTGDALIRTLNGTDFFDNFTLGETWQDIKAQLESVSNDTIDLDSPLDNDTFENEALAAAFDQMIIKARDGAHQFATAVQAVIARAEDLIYIETPALDPLIAGANGEVDMIGAIIERWSERPTISVVLCVPEKYLPDQPDKLDGYRAEGVSAAIKALQDAAPYDNVVLYTPTAGSGRPWYMASTTVIVDDVVAFTGSTHLWRRGLTFDSSISVGLFDENIIDGRPAAVRTARMSLFSQSLNLNAALALPDPTDMLDSVRQLNLVGGLQRVKPNVYSAATLDSNLNADRELWNPDGLPDGTSDWYILLASLFTNVPDDDNNAVR